MSTESQQFPTKALSLIEQSRYRMGTSRFIAVFIDHWAYLLTGLYPAVEEIPEDLQYIAAELSYVLAKAMKKNPTSDVLGNALSMSNFHKKGTNYFPTPSEIARLLSRLVGSEFPTDLYEPCCGSGIIAINWMESVIEEKGLKTLSGASLYLVDIDPLIHYFESRDISPKKMSIIGIDTLSRQTRGIAYYAEKRPEATIAAV